MNTRENEKWVSGLSDCCEASLKEIGEGLTILVCFECGQMCNKKYDEDDYYPDDFFEDNDDDSDYPK